MAKKLMEQLARTNKEKEDLENQFTNNSVSEGK
jgi:hypothetical protein